MSDNVNHPSHYNEHPTGIEIEHFTLNIGNAMKYLWRAGVHHAHQTHRGLGEGYLVYPKGDS